MPTESASKVESRTRSISDLAFSFIPALVILFAVFPLVTFILPSTQDVLTESYEPVKTLKFLYSRGSAFHKWGPMPSFVFAPVYAVVLAFFKWTGKIGHPASTYPFGFSDPLYSIGAMLAAARGTVLAVSLASLTWLAFTLSRLLRDSALPALCVLACVATSQTSVEPFADTKPDGLMIAFLAVALAAYAGIVLAGPTLRRSVAFGFLSVASISCKELTGPALVAMYAALFLHGAFEWLRFRDDRYLRLLLISVATFLGSYALFNIVYAPHSWVQRLGFVFGPLKDAGVWADPNQTGLGYLRSAALSVCNALGYGGLAALAFSVAASWRFRSVTLLRLWFPFAAHLIITVVVAGYIPPYFMLPLPVMLCLPCAYLATRVAAGRRLPVLVPVFTLVCAWLAVAQVQVFMARHPLQIVTRWIADNVPPGDSVYLVNLYPQHPRSTYLDAQGFHTSSQALFEIMAAPASARPRYAFIPANAKTFLDEFTRSPARASFFQRESGYDYRGFRGFEDLGYRLQTVARGQVPAFTPAWLVPFGSTTDSPALVYKLAP